MNLIIYNILRNKLRLFFAVLDEHWCNLYCI